MVKRRDDWFVNLFNEQKNYEAFKEKGKYSGTYELQLDDMHEAGGEIKVKYAEGKYFAECSLGSSNTTLKNFVINSGTISFLLEDYSYKGTILSEANGSIIMNVESKNDKMKFVRK